MRDISRWARGIGNIHAITSVAEVVNQLAV